MGWLCADGIPGALSKPENPRQNGDGRNGALGHFERARSGDAADQVEPPQYMRGVLSDDIEKDHPGGWENASTGLVRVQQKQLRLAPAFEA